MKFQTKIKGAFVAAVAALGLYAGVPAYVSAAPFEIKIDLGPKPHHDEVVVLEYDRYCVGFRAQLYDADWRLRNAQIEQWHAQEALDDARHRESEIAIALESNESIVAEYDKRVTDSDGALAAARAAVGRAADDAALARARLQAFEKRTQGARLDLEAARILHEDTAAGDAEARIRADEAALAQASVDLRLAEGRVADLQNAEATAATINDIRARLVDVRTRLPRLRDDLAVAHDAVFAAQQRMDGAIGAVALALHDRDEALWMLHRDEILTGRASFASCGFTIDLGVWGGRMPRDPEVVHAYFVHPVAFWVERPVEIQARVIEVDRIVEVSRIRTIQEKHEGPKFRELARFEAEVPVEKRRAFAEKVTIERQHLAEERTERAAAAAEHRALRVPDHVRAEAKAEVTKARAEGRAEQIEANANAKAEITKARADARAEQIEANGKARAEVTKTQADAKAEQIEAHGKTKAAEEAKAKPDPKSKTSKNDPKNDPKNKKPNNGQAYTDPGH